MASSALLMSSMARRPWAVLLWWIRWRTGGDVSRWARGGLTTDNGMFLPRRPRWGPANGSLVRRWRLVVQARGGAREATARRGRAGGEERVVGAVAVVRRIS